MANWSGAYIISAGRTGTATAVGASTLTNSGATFPTSPSLANFTLTIIGGTGSGQVRTVSTNTATQLTVSSPFSPAIDTTSTYKLELILNNSDHITAATSISTGIVLLVASNANIYFDGNFTIQLLIGAVCTLSMTQSTFPWFQANNRTTQGTQAFYTRAIDQISSHTGTFDLKFIKITECSAAVRYNQAAAPSSMTMSNIWCEQAVNCLDTTGAGNNIFTNISGFFSQYNRTGSPPFANVAATGQMIIKNSWFRRATSVMASGFAVAGAATSILRESVIDKLMTDTSLAATSNVFYATGCYLDDNYSGNHALCRFANATAGTFYQTQNVINNITLNHTVAATNAVYQSLLNDLVSYGGEVQAINKSAGALTTLTSDQDYIDGWNRGTISNIDQTLNTTSTNTPVMYTGLSATRTNAAATKNKLLSTANVSWTDGNNSIAVTFDCSNSGSTSTTVNSDSNSGQAVLNVASTTGLSIGMIIEIGKGTARYETGVIKTVSAGVSVTLWENLAFSHTSAQADGVVPDNRNWGLPFLEIGTSTGVYTSQTPIPPQSTWGLYFTGFAIALDGFSIAWNKVGHSLSISGLQNGQTYYARAGYLTPIGDVAYSSEHSFTTQAVPSYARVGNGGLVA